VSVLGGGRLEKKRGGKRKEEINTKATLTIQSKEQPAKSSLKGRKQENEGGKQVPCGKASQKRIRKGAKSQGAEEGKGAPSF